MRRPFLSFVLGVVVPSAMAMAVALGITASAWSHVQRESAHRVTRLALGAAAHTDAADPDADGVSMETLLAHVARVTGGVVDLYEDGRHAAGSPGDRDDPPPPRLEDPRAAWADLDGGVGPDGAFYLADRSATPTRVARLLPDPTRAGTLSQAMALVVLLLLLFSVLAGWIQLARPEGEVATASGRASAALLTLIPLLTTVVLMTHVTRRFEAESVDAPRRDLTLAAAVAAMAGVAGDPLAVRDLTGLHATRARDGRVVATSLPDSATASVVARLPSPPPSFTSSGRVEGPAGPSVYAAVRVGGGGFTAVLTPLDAGARRDHRRAMWVVFGVLVAWLLVVAWTTLRRTVSSGR